MNYDWQTFLSSNSAVLDKHEAAIPDMEKTYLCNLPELGLIKASGEEALSFLHGQFTNDLNQVSPSQSQLSSYCNAKGRLLAIFRIFKLENDYYLILRRDVLEVVLKKLTMFKLMAKVELADVTDEFVLFGIAGPTSDTILKEFNISFPTVIDQLIQEGETVVIRTPSESSRLLFISKAEQAKTIWKSLSNKAIQSSSNAWALHDIQSGVAQVTTETSEAFIPQMVNLELIGGVNFQKGCYPGQEIVARTHYLGKPNRRMYRICIDDEHCPQSGVNIFSVKDGEQPVGKIVIAQHSSEKTCEALAVLRTAKETAEDLHIETLSGPKVTLQSLPYSLDSESC